MKKGKITLKRVLSILLAVIMILPGNYVNAAAKPKLSVSSKSIFIGESYKLKVKNMSKSSRINWSSSDEKIATVSENGNVKGISKGTTLVTCKIDSKIKLEAKIKVIKKAEKIELTKPYSDLNVGDKKIIKAAISPKSSNDEISYHSSNESIAAINAKTGEIRAKKAGNATITAKTLSGKKVSYNVTVYDKTTRIARTQKELDSALNQTSAGKIVLSSFQAQTYNIPDGEYKKVDFIINVPNGDVKNYGLFNSITINGIKENTYYECADGNTILVVDNQSSIQVLGKPAEVQVLSGGIVNINLVGKKENLKIIVKNGTEIIATGESAGIVDIEIVDAGSKITSSIPINLTINGQAGKPEIVLIKGAENSTIRAEKEDQLGRIENRTEKEVKTTVGKDGETSGGGGGAGGGAVVIPETSNAKVAVGQQITQVNSGSILDKAKYEVTFTNMGLNDKWWIIREYDETGEIAQQGTSKFVPDLRVSFIQENGKYYIYLDSSFCKSGTYYLRLTDRSVISNLFTLRVGEETNKTEVKIEESDYVSLMAGEGGSKEYSVNSLHLSGDKVTVNWCDASGNNVNAPDGLTLSYATWPNIVCSQSKDSEVGRLAVTAKSNSKAGKYYFKASVNGTSSAAMPLVVKESTDNAKVTVGQQITQVNSGSILDKAKYEVTFTNMELKDNWWTIREYDETGETAQQETNTFPSYLYMSFTQENGKYYIYLDSSFCKTGTYYLRITDKYFTSNLFTLQVGEETNKTEVKIGASDSVNLMAGESGSKEYSVNSLHLSGDKVTVNWCDVSGNNVNAPDGLTLSYTTLANTVCSQSKDSEVGRLVVTAKSNSKAGVYYFKASVNGISSAVKPLAVVNENTGNAKVTVGQQITQVNSGSILDKAKYEVTFTNMGLNNNWWTIREYDETGETAQQEMNTFPSYLYVSFIQENGKYYIYLDSSFCKSGTYYLRLTDGFVTSNLFTLQVGEETNKTEVNIGASDFVNLMAGEGGSKEYSVDSLHLSGDKVAVNWCDASGNNVNAPDGLTLSYAAQLNTVCSRIKDSEVGTLVVTGKTNSRAGIYYFKASVNGTSSAVMPLVVK